MPNQSSVDRRKDFGPNEGLTFKRDAQHALDPNELSLAYQPIISTIDRQVIGAEALVRWTHPFFGEIPPSIFIPLAERTGFICELGLWVLERACSDARRWIALSGGDPFTIAVNISTIQLDSPRFASAVADILRKLHLDPRCLTLEITEGVLTKDSARSLEAISKLKSIGTVLSLDDFGTGYCSFSYLQRFPVGVIKIDQRFIGSLGHDRVSTALVSALVNFAHDLGLVVIAEGVETIEQYNEAMASGCDACQGYYFARPMPAKDFDALMNHGSVGGNPVLPALVSG